MGKKRSSQNALKHGLFSTDFIEERSAYVAALRAAAKGRLKGSRGDAVLGFDGAHHGRTRR
ncbi:MAG: hypothetical protein ABSF29_15545 [Tepidisphaeraceae bacterium]|jgi:hypothetical protein